mgnify:CR=1 FL=1|tara:strand:- start:1881 stop:2654 length:774 start_codon:yes stop_codon:yes gene_type:complete
MSLGLGTNITKAPYPYSTGGAVETQNYSAYLDGASDRIQGAGLSTTWLKVMTADAAFSIHFSVKLDTAVTIISHTGSTTSFVMLSTDANGDLSFTTMVSLSATGTVKFNAGLTTGTWYDIVITLQDQANLRTPKCYVNGSEVSVDTLTPFSNTTDYTSIAGKFTIGTFLNIVDYDFRIDRLASWNAVLSAAEVLEIYNNYPDLIADSGNYTSSSNLETYYKIEEGSGTTMSDSSGNSNGDLSVVNASGDFWSTDTRI